MRLIDCNRHVCRLEVKHSNEWGTVCDNGFTDTNANFVCKMMGFEKGLFKQACGTQGEFASCAANTGGAGRVWLDDVFCFGFERDIDGCRHKPWGQNRCGHKQDVGVCCSGGEVEKLQQEIEDAGSNMVGISALEEMIQQYAGAVAADKAIQDSIQALGGQSAGKAFAPAVMKAFQDAIIHLSQVAGFDETAFQGAISATAKPDGLFSLEAALIAAGGKAKEESAIAIIQTSVTTIDIAVTTASSSTAGAAAFQGFRKAVKAESVAAVGVKAVQQAIIAGKASAISKALVAAGGSAKGVAAVQQAITNAGGPKAVAVALKAKVVATAAKVAAAAINGPPGSCPSGELSYDLKKGVDGLKSLTGGDDLGIMFGGSFAGAEGFRFKSGMGLVSIPLAAFLRKNTPSTCVSSWSRQLEHDFSCTLLAGVKTVL